MQSKTWCCKLSRPLIRKDITRFWPIWSSYLAIWLMLLPIPLLNSLAESRSGRTDVLCTVYRQIVTAGGNASLVMTLIFAYPPPPCGAICSRAAAPACSTPCR